MGFYGNKLLGSNTTFQFDRIYPNRYEMEQKILSDGVYIGRYVLIDYGLNDDLKNPTDLNMSRYFYVKPNTSPIEIYISSNYENSDRLKLLTNIDILYDPIKKQEANNNLNQKYYEKNEKNGNYTEVFPPFFGDDNVYTLKGDADRYILGGTIIYAYSVSNYKEISYTQVIDKNKIYFYWDTNAEDYRVYTGAIPMGDNQAELTFYEGENVKKVFYRVKDNMTSGEEGYALFEELSNSGLSNYTINYNIDLAAYTNNNGGKGYDSTVWQKTYQDGKEIYINIADLNTVIPTFDVTVDGPTLEPRPPHFDANSTNVYYNLHTQPSWGFRVKEAERKLLETYNGVEIYSSTDKNSYPTEGESTIVDQNYWIEDNGIKKDEKKSYTYESAIYYNKKGFDPEKRSDVNTHSANSTDNLIQVTPTGQSGQKYNTHNNIPYDVEAKPDIQELSVNLPGLGNTISKLWDLAYGDWEANGSKYVKVKKDKISKEYDQIYYNESGDKYSKEYIGDAYIKDPSRNLNIDWDDTTGLRLINEIDEKSDGFTFSTEKVNNLAGCINSVHDLMGMIVVAEDKDKNWETEALEDADTNSIYYKESDGKYYMKDFTYKYEDFDYNEFTDPDYENKYEYKEISILNFDNDKYYTKQNKDYHFQKDYAPNTVYYQIQATEKTLNDNDWSAGIYHYKDGNNFIKELDTQESYINTRTLYNLDSLPGKHLLYTTSNSTPPVYPVEFIKSSWYANRTNKWYLKTENDGRVDYTKLDEWNYSPDLIYENKDYYELELEDGDPNGDIYIDGKQLGESIKSSTVIRFSKRKDEYNYYYINENGDYIANNLETHLTSDDCNKYNIIGLPNTLEAEKEFYVPNKYYYKLNNGNNYYYGDEKNRRLDVKYYVFNTGYPIKINKYFYEPNKYYYKDNNIYYLDTDNYDENKTYYLKQTVHVWNDNNLALPKYTVWNPKVIDIPNGVILKRKVIDDTPDYKWVELEGFARTLNTIHGLIIRINHMLEFNDLETRENTSVMGCINQMHDIINSFADLIPEQFAVIDNYGRVQSAEIVTDKWLDVQIDGNPEAPKVNFKHEYNPVSNTTSTYNVNNNGDTIELYTPNIDSKGHVIGKDIKTVTLPYGFKTINGCVADNTQDTLIINGDSWINVPTITDSPDDKFTITHKFTASNGENTTYDVNGNGNTIILETPKTDATGHVVGTNVKTVTLPYSFKKINGIIADSTQDTLSINGDNWINLSENTDTDTLIINHKSYELIEGNNYAPVLSEEGILSIPYASPDNAGHITNINLQNIQLPKNYNKIKIDESEDNILIPVTFEDTLNFKSGGHIELGFDKNTSSITINHTPLRVREEHVYEGIKIKKDNPTITVFDYGFDESYGHCTSESSRTYDLSELLNSSGLTIDSQLTDYISDEYTDIYYPDVEIGEDFNGITVPIPADIQSTDTLGRTLHRLMTWIQILNRRVLELEGHTMSGNVMG